MHTKLYLSSSKLWWTQRQWKLWCSNEYIHLYVCVCVCVCVCVISMNPLFVTLVVRKCALHLPLLTVKSNCFRWHTALFHLAFWINPSHSEGVFHFPSEFWCCDVGYIGGYIVYSWYILLMIGNIGNGYNIASDTKMIGGSISACKIVHLLCLLCKCVCNCLIAVRFKQCLLI